MGDEDERALKVAAWNKRLEATGTPLPFRQKWDTQEMVKAQQGAEQRVSEALGIPALTPAGRAQLAKEIAAAEERCEGRYVERIVELETLYNFARGESESLKRETRVTAFNTETVEKSLRERIESLERQLDAERALRRKAEELLRARTPR